MIPVNSLKLLITTVILVILIIKMILMIMIKVLRKMMFQITVIALLLTSLLPSLLLFIIKNSCYCYSYLDHSLHPKELLFHYHFLFQNINNDSDPFARRGLRLPWYEKNGKRISFLRSMSLRIYMYINFYEVQCVCV